MEDRVATSIAFRTPLLSPANPKAKSEEPVKIELNHMNSFFVDVAMVQATMVRLYGTTPERMFLYRSTMQTVF